MTDAPALIADIGGTHVRFALVEPGREPSDPIVMRSADYAGPAEAAGSYLAAMAPRARPKRAAFAVASAITGDTVDLTNSTWRFSIGAVRRELGLDRLDVVNDFTAVALSVRYLSGEHLVKLGGELPAPGAPIAVLGPGTGLGVSALVPVGNGEWVPLATEGGHVTMAPVNAREAAVLDWLRRRFEHVSAERVLSGPGLVNLFEAVAGVHGRPATYTTPDAISQRALDGSCALCAEALEMFFCMLGTVAGNLVLTLGARGGLYVAGGILPRMKDAFAESGFRARFEDKGRFQTYLEPVPAWLVVHPQPAFLGLAGLCA